MSEYQCSWPSGIGYMPTSSPCGPINKTNPVVSCCANGDFCLSDNICAYTSHSNVGGSGYYTAGCSDGKVFTQGSSSACVNRCSDTGLTDIVYDNSDGTWKCCGGNEYGRNCQSPTNETFIGPPPSDLVTIWVAGSTATIMSTPSSISMSTATRLVATTTSTSPIKTPTPSPEGSLSDTKNSSGLSTGAKAGIGIGVSIAVLALLAVTLVYFHRRRQDGQRDITREKGRDHVSSSRGISELSPVPELKELPSDTQRLPELY